jgi:hypothetical protein
MKTQSASGILINGGAAMTKNTIKDAAQNVIGYSGIVAAPMGQHVNVPSQLPWFVYAVTKQVDQDAVQFAYAGTSWDSSTCSLGGMRMVIGIWIVGFPARRLKKFLFVICGTLELNFLCW